MNDRILENNIYLISNAIDKKIIDFIKPYFILNEIKNPNKKDTQVPTAYSSYADALTETILLNIHKLIENKTDLKLFPTYSYYRIYRKGDILHPHVDRPSCEVSATLCLGYSYSSLDYEWPIFIDGVGYNLNPGDIAIYKGLDQSHWRNKFDPPNDNDYHIQVFLHYVDSNGLYKDWAYDKRKGLGHDKEFI